MSKTIYDTFEAIRKAIIAGSAAWERPTWEYVLEQLYSLVELDPRWALVTIVSYAKEADVALPPEILADATRLIDILTDGLLS